MSFALRDERAETARWVLPGHSKQEVSDREASIGAEAQKLPTGSDVQQAVKTISVIGTVEGISIARARAPPTALASKARLCSGHNLALPPRNAGLACWSAAVRYHRGMRTASCTCGQLKVSCEADPVRVSLCHCLACQKRTGSAFALTARWPAEQVTIEGRSHEYVRVGDEGSSATFRFCPTCAVTVYFDSDGIPGMISVPVGVFADPTFPAPQVSVYGVRRHAWAVMPNLAIEELE